MSEAFTRASEIAARNHGLIRRDELILAGMSRNQIEWMIKTQRLVRVARSVYRFAGVPTTPDQQLAMLAMTTVGAASHRSAANLLAIIGWCPRQPEVTVHPTANYRGPGRVHRHADLVPRDLTVVRNIPCTNAVRTVIDIGAVRPDLVEEVFHSALRLQLCTYDEIVSRFIQIARRGRDGVGRLRPILEAHDPAMPPVESKLELVLLRSIREVGLKEPVRQHEVAIRGRRYRIDLAYPEEKVAIEGDGFGVHSERQTFESDRLRQNDLQLDGWLVLRFTWRQITADPGHVLRTIADALSSRSNLGDYAD